MRLFYELFRRSIDKGIYTNFGPNERELTQYFENSSDASVVCIANATLFLDFLHLTHYGYEAYVPSFTFPATNLALSVSKRNDWTTSPTNTDGFADHSIIKRATLRSYAITTAPFGSYKEIGRPANADLWIVDNAAGLTPSLDRVKGWLAQGADAVVVSLHATKLLPAGEGGVVFFRDQYLYELYKEYINFGKHGNTCGSNHKMSELHAAMALSYIQSGKFEKSFNKRVEVADRYEAWCRLNSVHYIRSEQAFWIELPERYDLDSTFSTDMLDLGIEVRKYYSPYMGINKQNDATGWRMSQNGHCLPSWGMSKKDQKRVLEGMEKCLNK